MHNTSSRPAEVHPLDTMVTIQRVSFFRSLLTVLLVTVALMLSLSGGAQTTNVVFFEDFESGTIDNTRLIPDAPFFEGGVGDISAQVVLDDQTESNVVEFTGTVSQQWWAGATLRVAPTFKASVETNVVVSVDRVLEAGVGTAARSALWIMDSTRTRFVLFSDLRGEGNWGYNRSIGESGDAPSGSGFGIAAFTEPGSPYLDGALHTMKAVADGQTVKLYLDETFGVEVKFPFSDLVVEIGSYARALNDTADTKFDNLSVSYVGVATFKTTSLTIPAGQTSAGTVTVRIPAGSNADQDVLLRIVSSDPSIAIAAGAVNGVKILKFAKGGSSEASFEVQGTGAVGGARFTLEDDFGIAAGNSLVVTAIPNPSLWFTEDFGASELNASRWTQNNKSPFYDGTATVSVDQTDGALYISGGSDQVSYWAGASLKSVSSYTATRDLPLTVSADRVSLTNTRSDDSESGGVVSGLFLTTDDGAGIFIDQTYLRHDWGDPYWEVMTLKPGGVGQTYFYLPNVDPETQKGSHNIKLVADGENVTVYLDGKEGGSYPFPATYGIHVEMGAYTYESGDQVTAVFDNVRAENSLPCVGLSPGDISAVVGDSPRQVDITISRLLNKSVPTSVTLTSSDPSVFVPEGAVNGSLSVLFSAGAETSAHVNLLFKGIGNATLTASSPDTCTSSETHVSVIAPPVTKLTESFAAETIDETVWRVERTPLKPSGVASDDSVALSVDGYLQISVTNSAGDWPGITLFTQSEYSAGPTTPAIFEVDRVKLDKVLTTGTGATQRTGLWVSDAARLNYVFFNEYKLWYSGDGGWEYIVVTNSPDGFINTDAGGIIIPAFGASRFNDSGNHHLKAVANGSSVKLYLDGIFGVEVPFALSEGIVFGIGAYVAYATDVVYGTFDNARVSVAPAGPGELDARRAANGDVNLSWTGSGILQSSTSLAAGATWSDVSPAPAGNTLTIQRAAQAGTVFYRLRR